MKLVKKQNKNINIEIITKKELEKFELLVE